MSQLFKWQLKFYETSSPSIAAIDFFPLFLISDNFLSSNHQRLRQSGILNNKIYILNETTT